MTNRGPEARRSQNSSSHQSIELSAPPISRIAGLARLAEGLDAEVDPVRREPASGASDGLRFSRPNPVVEVNHAVAETAFVQQLERQADVVGKGPLAAAHHDGRDEQVALVDQPGLERLGGEVGTADG